MKKRTLSFIVTGVVAILWSCTNFESEIITSERQEILTLEEEYGLRKIENPASELMDLKATSIDDLKYQIETIIKNENVDYTERFNVHFARMGEPTWNKNVLDFAYMLKPLVKRLGLVAHTVHPVVSTMLPSGNKNLVKFLDEWCYIKNHVYHGEAGLQFSINSTDEAQREELFAHKSLPLSDIERIADMLPMPKGRKYTLNFPVTAQTILDAKALSQMFDKDKFIVKITPIHETASAIENGFEVTGYADYDVYRKFEQPLLKEGWDVIVFVPSKEEDSDRITCGNALIAGKTKTNEL